MKIGISLLWLTPGYGGLETYVRGLLAGLAKIDRHNRYILFTNPETHALFERLPARFDRRLCKVPLKSRVVWRIVEQLLLSRFATRERLDVLHAPADVVPLRCPCPTVVTVHDVNFYSLADKLPALAGRLFESHVKRSVRHADAIITVSEFSRQEITSKLGESRRRVCVIHNASTRSRPPSLHKWPGLALRLGISRDYLLAFSDGSPHKNLPALVRAFRQLTPKYPVQLVVVGRRPQQDLPLRRLVGRLGLNESIVFVGYLEDADLRALLAHARLLAFPSLYEGFGLPVVEAMAAGVPVACSASAALPEVAGEAALFFNPSSVTDMATTVERVLVDEPLRERLIAAGYRRARQFSWERAALQTLKVYGRVAKAMPFPHYEAKAIPF